MLSKCDHNDYYSQSDADNTGGHYFMNDKYFAELKKNFPYTRFYQEALQECGYFKEFAGDN